MPKNKKKELPDMPDKIDETLVLNELPKQEVRQFEDDKGRLIGVMTRDEAITEILRLIRENNKILSS